MKKIFLSLFISASFFLFVSANENNEVKVNGAVLSSFKNDFHHTSNVSWKRSGSIYIASFTQFDGNYRAYYTAEGDLLGFLSSASMYELPGAVKKTLNKRFPAADFVSVSKLYSPATGLSFMIIVADKDHRKVIHIDREGSVETVKAVK